MTTSAIIAVATVAATAIMAGTAAAEATAIAAPATTSKRLTRTQRKKLLGWQSKDGYEPIPPVPPAKGRRPSALRNMRK